MEEFTDKEFSLLLLDALERQMHTSVTEQQFHAFAYFVSALAPLKGFEVRWDSVLKWESGPYFLDVEAGIQELLKDAMAEYISEDAEMPLGQRTFHGLVLTKAGRLAVENRFGKQEWQRGELVGAIEPKLAFAVEVSAHVSNLARYPLDVPADRIVVAACLDPSYLDPGVVIGTSIDFAASNYTVECCNAFDSYISVPRLTWYHKLLYS